MTISNVQVLFKSTIPCMFTKTVTIVIAGWRYWKGQEPASVDLHADKWNCERSQKYHLPSYWSGTRLSENPGISHWYVLFYNLVASEVHIYVIVFLHQSILYSFHICSYHSFLFCFIGHDSLGTVTMIIITRLFVHNDWDIKQFRPVLKWFVSFLYGI